MDKYGLLCAIYSSSSDNKCMSFKGGCSKARADMSKSETLTITHTRILTHGWHACTTHTYKLHHGEGHLEMKCTAV